MIHNKKMRHIKEPEDFDFVIESKPLTNKERKEISEWIASLKEKRSVRKKTVRKKTNIKENYKAEGVKKS